MLYYMDTTKKIIIFNNFTFIKLLYYTVKPIHMIQILMKFSWIKKKNGRIHFFFVIKYDQLKNKLKPFFALIVNI